MYTIDCVSEQTSIFTISVQRIYTGRKVQQTISRVCDFNPCRLRLLLTTSDCNSITGKRSR